MDDTEGEQHLTFTHIQEPGPDTDDLAVSDRKALTEEERRLRRNKQDVFPVKLQGSLKIASLNFKSRHRLLAHVKNYRKKPKPTSSISLSRPKVELTVSHV